MKCNNTLGGYICPPCAPGFNGSSNQKCNGKKPVLFLLSLILIFFIKSFFIILALCGDTVWNSAIGEDCVSCPYDRLDTTCSMFFSSFFFISFLIFVTFLFLFRTSLISSTQISVEMVSAKDPRVVAPALRIVHISIVRFSSLCYLFILFYISFFYFLPLSCSLPFYLYG